MEEFYTILIITAIIQIITLIVFFVMAANVSKIKKELQKELTYDDYIDKSEEEKFIGNKLKAKEWLLRLDYNLQKEIDRINAQENDFFKYQKINAVKNKRDIILIRINDLDKI